MSYTDLVVLIPSHSLEDFPAEQSEMDAASLLNSFAVMWHPALLAAAKVLPRWLRGDDPPDSSQRRLIFLPTPCESWVPAGWAERMEDEGSVVVRGCDTREQMLQVALRPLEGAENINADLVADFLALGSCQLQMELLTRRMRNFSNIDEVYLQREVVTAAEAAVAGDLEAARSRLKSCFEVLTEARERFYPVECYLLDLCLLIPKLGDQHLVDTLLTLKPMNVLISASDLEELAQEQPAGFAALKEAWERSQIDVITGEWGEPPLPLLPLNSILWHFDKGLSRVRALLGKQPVTWGRRRYGVFPQLPQILKKYGYQGALHLVLDDGIYPDQEHSRLRWEGCDGSVLEALSRIPLATDSATSYLRFSSRMSESMDNDQTAAVIFARWPEVQGPWFEDLRRMHQYSPSLGRFITLEEFFVHTDHPTHPTSYRAGEYLTPYFVQSVAREEVNPISRYTTHFLRRQKFDTARWLLSTQDALLGRPILGGGTTAARFANSAHPESAARYASQDSERAGQPVAAPLDLGGLEQALEELGEKPAKDQVQLVEAHLESSLHATASQLAKLVLSRAGQQPGYLVFNPLSYKRMISVPFTSDQAPPQLAAKQPQTFLQWDDRQRLLTLEVPGCGFAWVPAGAAGASPHIPPAPIALAEEYVLRNEFFEVHISPQTGGIQQIKGYGRTPNRLSQQLNYRFSRERTFTITQGDSSEEIKSYYAAVKVDSLDVTSTGPAVGEIVSRGQIYDQKNNQKLAGFLQTTRVYRGRPLVEVEIELDIARMPDAEPWMNYYTSRFAWNDETASLTRGAWLGAHGVTEERFETPYYLEIATPEQRTTIIPCGLPFHRKTGHRMLDSILVSPRESARKFRLVIAIDQPYPLQPALDALTPVVCVPTPNGPPTVGTSGWFYHVDAKNVQITDVLPLLAEPVEATEAWNPPPAPEPPTGPGFALRLIETEGRAVRAKVRCFRTPSSARQRDFLGKTLTDLTLEGDAVVVDLTAHEIADIELKFS